MKFRRLGRTGLGVGPISLGTMGFGPPTEQDTADRLVRYALDRGVNLIDTANCYDGPNRNDVVRGHSETMLGRILSDGLRDEAVLLTKVGVPLRPGPQHRGLSATHILRELDASLRRLKTDYVDIYMLHWPDAFSEPEEVLRVMDRAVQAGKVRHFGISNHLAWQVAEYLWQGDLRNWIKPGVCELPLSLLERKYKNDLPFYERHAIGVLVYQPLAGGRLAPRDTGGGASPDSDGESPKVAGWDHKIDEQQRQRIAGLDKLAGEAGMTLIELALRWAYAQPGVTSVLLGAQTCEQLDSAVRAVQTPISPQLLSAVDAVCPGPEKPVPRFER